jgi:Bacterial Ig-like domain (group 3)/MBG domain
VTATTAPAGLNVDITYNGGSTPPTNPGSYAVAATISDASYTGSATGTLVISVSGQTINFTPLASSVTYGVAPITLLATASSSLPVMFAVTGPGTVSGNILTITGAGIVGITASQSGDSDYSAAPLVRNSIVVNQATPSISWSAPASIPYGTPLSSTQLNASVTGVSGTTLAGSAVYTPAAGSVLTAGTHVLSVTIIPTDTTDYTSASSSVSVVVRPTNSTVTLISSANPALVQNSITFTAKVSGVTTPTGTVTFLNGVTPLGAAVPLDSNGVATLTTSFTTTGNDAITALYSGDTNFPANSSPAVSETVEDFNFTIAPTTGSGTGSGSGSSSATIAPGQSANFGFTISGTNGAFSFPVSLSATGLPPGATVSFNPRTITIGSAPVNVTMTINIPGEQAHLRPERIFGGGAIAVGLLLLPFSRKMRRQGRKLSLLMGLVLLLGLDMIGMSGCGASNGFFNQPSKTYTINIVAMASGSGATLQHVSTITVTVE